MDPRQLMALALDPSLILAAQGMVVDPWQRDLLLSQDKQVLLNCCRQAGKSTVTGALALHNALFTPAATILLLSPGQRQSGELFRKILAGYNAIGRPVRATYETQLKIELDNGSRIICLPGKEEPVRGFTRALLVIDEASRVPDDLWGWFWSEWETATPPPRRASVLACLEARGKRGRLPYGEVAQAAPRARRSASMNSAEMRGHCFQRTSTFSKLAKVRAGEDVTMALGATSSCAFSVFVQSTWNAVAIHSTSPFQAEPLRDRW